MTDRVASAERLLATIQVGRDHIRALALRHLPAGRAIALDLRVASGLPPRPAYRVPSPSASVENAPPATVSATSSPTEESPTRAQPSIQEPLPAPMDAGDAPPPGRGALAAAAVVATAAGLHLANQEAPVPEDPSAEGPGTDFTTKVPADASPPEAGPSQVPAEAASNKKDDALESVGDLQLDGGGTEEASGSTETEQRAPSTPPAPAEDDLDESTQVIEVDDDLKAAIARARLSASPALDAPAAAPVMEAPTEGLDWGDAPAQSAEPANDDPAAEDTDDEDTDPGLLAPLASALAEDESAIGAQESTLLQQGSDLFGGQLSPTSGWEFDDEDSIVDEGTIGGLSWDDPPSREGHDDDDLSGSFEDTLALHFPNAIVPREAPAQSLDEPDDERTRIGAPDPALLDAIHAADAPSADTLEDDFELSADQLQWGDARGEPQSEEVSASVPLVRSVEPSPDELQWGGGSTEWNDASEPDAPARDGFSSGDDFALDDLSGEDFAPDDLSGEDFAPDDLSGEDHPGAIPQVMSWADESDENAATDAHPGLSSGPDTAVPDVLEDDPLDRTQMHASLPAPSLREPAPLLAVPRVVEPASHASFDEPSGAAAIQILGVGRAQTLTPTLELGGAEEEPDAAANLPPPPTTDGGFSLQFAEPEEAADGPHIPVLTEEAPMPLKPVMLSKDGVIVPSKPRAAHDHQLATAEVSRFLELADSAVRKGNLRDAVVHYDDLLSHAPHNLVGHLGRGRCLVDLGDYGAAMSDFTRAEDIAPDSPEPLVEMGNLFFARKEYKRAITYYNHAIDLDNAHAMAFSRRGISHYHRRMYAEAHNDLTEAEKHDDTIPGLQRYIQMTARKLKKRR